MQDEKVQYKKYLNDRKGADQYNEFKKILYGQPDSLVVKIFAFLFPFVKKRKNLKILDVGGGDGKRLRQLIDLLKSKNIDVSATLVEPSKTFTDDCRQAVKGSHYDIKIVRSLIEDYKTTEKFDLILMIHSFYSFRDFPIFEKMSSMLERGGRLIIIGNDADSFLAKLKRITGRRRKGSRKDIDFIFSELKRNKFKYKVKKEKTIFDDCLKDGKLTADGQLIVSWIALSDYSQIPPDMKKEILELFQGESKNSKLMDREVFISAWK